MLLQALMNYVYLPEIHHATVYSLKVWKHFFFVVVHFTIIFLQLLSAGDYHKFMSVYPM